MAISRHLGSGCAGKDPTESDAFVLVKLGIGELNLRGITSVSYG